MTDSLLTDVAWIFFATWSLLIAGMSIAAFGPDLLPSKAAQPKRQAPVLQIRPDAPK